MTDTALVLQTQTLPSFNDSSFFSSLDAIDDFFSSIDNATKNLQDDQLLNLFTLVNQLGGRAWVTRAIIVEEILNRTKKSLGKEELTKKEFETHVARALDIAKTTAYTDLQILKEMKEMKEEGQDMPILDRTFYTVALTAPDFKKAVTYAVEQNDSLGGKYTAREFLRWVTKERGEANEEETKGMTVYLGLVAEEIEILIEAYRTFLKNDPNPQGEMAEELYQKLKKKLKESKL